MQALAQTRALKFRSLAKRCNFTAADLALPDFFHE
eukprot:gene4781-870_t